MPVCELPSCLHAQVLYSSREALTYPFRTTLRLYQLRPHLNALVHTLILRFKDSSVVYRGLWF